MKSIIIFLILLHLLVSPLLANISDSKMVLSIFNQIDKNRIPSEPNFKIYDPFIRIKRAKANIKSVSITKMIFPKLSAIMDNRAFINGHWVKSGDMVRDFKIMKISSEGVQLKRLGKRYFLNFSSKRDIVQVISKNSSMKETNETQ